MGTRRWLWVGLGLGIFLCLLVPLTCLGIGMTSLSTRDTTSRAWTDAIAVVRVEGTIVSGKQPEWPYWGNGNAFSETIVDRLHRADDDPSVKAIVLRVDSPGGAVVASDEIYQALLETEKPIVASMGAMAASGGYYIACGADEIVANPTTLTGSIGVISTVPNFEELLDKIGIDMLVIKSGAMKDELSPYREPTEEEIEHWQAITDEAYEQFVGIVAERRELDPDEAHEIADGRVYSGQQALELRLVDELGNLPQAIDIAADLGDIEGEPHILEYERAPTLLEVLTGTLRQSGTPVSLDDFLDIERRFTLQYLYVRP